MTFVAHTKIKLHINTYLILVTKEWRLFLIEVNRNLFLLREKKMYADKLNIVHCPYHAGVLENVNM